MKKLNNYHSIGMLFMGIYLFANHYSFFPDIIKGFCVGIGFVFTFIGLYVYNHDISKFRNKKIEFLKSSFGK